MVVHVADKNFFFKNDDSFGKIKLPVAMSIAAKFAQKLASQSVEDLDAMVVRVTDKYLFPTRSDPSGFIKLPITFPKAAPSPDKLPVDALKTWMRWLYVSQTMTSSPKTVMSWGNWNCREEEKNSSGGGVVGEQTGEGEADMIRGVKNMSFSKCYSQPK